MEKKLTALQKAIKDLRRMNTACTLYIADMLEKDYLPKEREQIEEGYYQGLQKGDLLSRSTPPTASDYFTQTYQSTE